MATISNLQNVYASSPTISGVLDTGEKILVNEFTTLEPYATYYKEIMSGKHGPVSPYTGPTGDAYLEAQRPKAKD